MSQLRVRPTDDELAILQVLWDRGPATVRQVHEALFEARETGYTTTLKLMQIMAEKGLVVRDESARTHVYTAKFTPDETQQRLVSDLMDRSFGGSAAELVMQVLSTHPTSADELQDIEHMIAEFRATTTPARSGGRIALATVNEPRGPNAVPTSVGEWGMPGVCAPRTRPPTASLRLWGSRLGNTGSPPSPTSKQASGSIPNSCVSCYPPRSVSASPTGNK